jgi:uncharacterized DUF497 family protein
VTRTAWGLRRPRHRRHRPRHGSFADHGVSFRLAMKVGDDCYHVVLPDRIEGGEQRWRAIGMVGPVALLLVGHANPDPQDEDRFRIIGAR